MTFDDGILTVYKLERSNQAPAKPVYKLVEKERMFYGFDVIGINRYYTALKANQQITAVVNVPEWPAVEASDIVILEDTKQYRLAMIQPMWNDENLKITKLSLERITQNYELDVTD